MFGASLFRNDFHTKHHISKTVSRQGGVWRETVFEKAYFLRTIFRRKQARLLTNNSQTSTALQIHSREAYARRNLTLLDTGNLKHYPCQTDNRREDAPTKLKVLQITIVRAPIIHDKQSRSSDYDTSVHHSHEKQSQNCFQSSSVYPALPPINSNYSSI